MQIIDEPWSWDISLKEFLKDNTPSKWKTFFEDEKVQKELEKISDYLLKQNKLGDTIFPCIYQVFRAFSIAPEDIKVVILGQDCYHDGNAVGLCFSVPQNGGINPSLRNIYKEIENSGYTPNKNGSLVHWVKQGCFLINTALTVAQSRAGSHIHIWYNFSEMLVRYLSENYNDIIWLCMGKPAYEISEEVSNTTHVKIITSHPSPLSASREFRNFPAFLGSKVFEKINEKLQEKEKKKISW